MFIFDIVLIKRKFNNELSNNNQQSKKNQKNYDSKISSNNTARTV